MPLSTATVSMVHSVPELMVSSEVSRHWGTGLYRELGHPFTVVVSEASWLQVDAWCCCPEKWKAVWFCVVLFFLFLHK